MTLFSAISIYSGQERIKILNLVYIILLMLLGIVLLYLPLYSGGGVLTIDSHPK